VREATEFGPACPQQLYGAQQELSEDCLFLNVWAPPVEVSGDAPVMVWIHGGGLNLGFSHRPFYDGSEFAKRGVVLVSINYRLGPLGFLAHAELSDESAHGVSGNYGFLDQIAALKWVQENISDFGGDSGNVTIFGESAGGTSVATLASSPLAEGLFHKAIIESPWMFGYVTRLAEPVFVNLHEPVANVASAEQLGAVWAEEFIEEPTGDVMVMLRSMPWSVFFENRPYFKTRVTIDGWLLPERPEDTFLNGRQHDVPLMIGTNEHEGNYFRRSFQYEDRSEFVVRMQDFYGPQAEAVLGVYPGQTKEELADAVSLYVSNAWFLQSTRQLLRGMERVSSPAYRYLFSRTSRRFPALGSPHGMELRYVFNTLLEEYAEPRDFEIATEMIQYWTQFAATGNPNVEGMTDWPEYVPGSESYLEIGDQLVNGAGWRSEQLDVLDRAEAQVLGGTGQ
jgi:para-nitrobenzyl esterase